jgi:hypothetical protein
MYLECGPQSIKCIKCKNEFGGDIFLDARVYGDVWRSLVCCPYCDCLFLHKKVNIFQNKSTIFQRIY